MEIISTFSAMSFGEKRRRTTRGGSFVKAENFPKSFIHEKDKPFTLPSNIPVRLASFLLKLCGPESGFAFSRPESCPVFGCIARPSLSLTDYAKRLNQLMKCSPETLIVAAVLIQRMYKSSPEIFCELSTHRILGTALVIACKFCEDTPVANSFHASCLGISVQDLNLMEINFLQNIQFCAFVSTHQFEQTGLQLAAIGMRKYRAPRTNTSTSLNKSKTTNSAKDSTKDSSTTPNTNNPDENEKEKVSQQQTTPRKLKRKLSKID
eukprot:c17710_g1_i1.p1 GENE.c17710_g1_i1~~c17710_g1_i1.p1  ORF type:complete len:265 (+),score=54.78 c17710_g1_i1:134-928(+)